MEVGDKFNTKGYNMVAMIDRYTDDGGIVLVMHNNSSHYLIATVPEINVQMAIDDNPLEFDAMLVEMTEYGHLPDDEKSMSNLYEWVMDRALKVACPGR